MKKQKFQSLPMLKKAFLALEKKNLTSAFNIGGILLLFRMGNESVIFKICASFIQIPET